VTATFDALPTAPGTEAVVHGMLATLAEVLERLDGRMAELETAVARQDAERRTADDVVGDRLRPALAAIEARIGEVEARVARPDTSALEAQLATVADRVAHLHEAVNRSRGEATMAVEQVGESLVERLGGLEGALGSLGAVRLRGSDDLPGLEDVLDRLARVESMVQQHTADQEARAAKLTAEVQSVLGSGMERLLTHAGAADELLTSDLRGALQRLTEVASAVDGLGTGVTAVHEQLARLTAEERTRPLVAAMETAAREHREAMAELQTALVRRIDGRTSALARLVDGNGELEPLLQRLASALDEQDTRGKELAEALQAVPGRVEEQVGSLREDLEQVITGMSRRQSATLKLLERLGAELGDEHRRLETVQSLCQSVAAAVEQQAAVGGRVAELVLETRSVMRSDVERLESTVHLEAVKGRQQDQARLAQLAAGVTEVVERETALVAQRVAALSGVVEGVRAAVHTQAAPALED
jgi:ABC-type transporter Mla subunit MlaD